MQGVLIYKRFYFKGPQPPSRAFSPVVSLNNHKFALYAGSGGDLFNDMRTVDPDNLQWQIIHQDGPRNDLTSRFGHVTGSFDKYLVSFGGFGQYDMLTRSRITFNDIVAFNTEDRDSSYIKFEGSDAALKTQLEFGNSKVQYSGQSGVINEHVQMYHASRYRDSPVDEANWTKTRMRSGTIPPISRAFAAGCTVGCGMFVHGGIGVEKGTFKQGTLSDFLLFDIGLFCWIKVTVYDADNKASEVAELNLVRKMHTMTAIKNSSVGGQIKDEVLNSRLMWCNKL